jgi:glutamate dehydrogenase
MFELARSSWADYDRSVISSGGGIWPRSAKSIPLSEQARAALGISETVTAMSPPQLVRAILTAPVDLLFNGGIGTYVKASTESDADAGDKANDAVRVEGRDLRVKVVGEGGNLGLTQRGRIEFALRGGRISTDFIDNSAGVDCSDHEVNIKILLQAAITAGELDPGERNPLLADMTGEIAELVLRDNYDQAVTLGNAWANGRQLLPVHRRLIADLERRGTLDRQLEALPTDEEIDARAAAGTGLTTPEYAVLNAYVKIGLERDILGSALPDEAWTHQVLVDYFPAPLRERFAGRMASHPLRREIVTTRLVNEAVNRGGTTFFFRAMEETAASPVDVLRAYAVVREVYGLPELWQAVESLDGTVPLTVLTTLYLEIRRLLDRAVRWLVTNRRSPVDVAAEIDRLQQGVSRLVAELDTRLRCNERAALRARTDELHRQGVPQDIAHRVVRTTHGFRLLDIVETARASAQDVDEVAGVYFVLSEQFQADNLLSKISALPREDRWQTFARMALRHDLYAALARVTADVIRSTSPSLDAQQRVLEWERAHTVTIARARTAISEFDESPADLAALSVLLRQIQTMIRSSAA